MKIEDNTEDICCTDLLWVDLCPPWFTSWQIMHLFPESLPNSVYCGFISPCSDAKWYIKDQMRDQRC